MKRKEILMLVCAFFLGFFANAIMKSIRIGKLYEGLEPQSCMDSILDRLNQGETITNEYLNSIGCNPSNNSSAPVSAPVSGS